jgi:hypothetical protein
MLRIRLTAPLVRLTLETDVCCRCLAAARCTEREGHLRQLAGTARPSGGGDAVEVAQPRNGATIGG